MAGRGRPRKQPQKQQKPIEPEVKLVVDLPKVYCLKCGCTNQKNFYASKDPYHAFFGKIPYCKDCIKNIYMFYLKKYDDINLAIYYTCRKIDAPYIHANFLGALENVKNPNAKIQGEDAIVSAYMKGLSFAEVNEWGNSFDDSQGEADIEKLYAYDVITKIKRNKINSPNSVNSDDNSDDYEIIEYDTDILQSKWGMTFENWELAYLEGEYLDWDEKLNGINDKTIDILVKQICYQLLDIYRDRQAGTPVDKKIKTLTELMNNSGLIEKQDKAQEKHKALGMEIADIEFMRPATTGKQIFTDVDGVNNYIKGAAGCFFKAMGQENEYTEFYDEWMKKYKVPIVDEMLATKQAEERIINSIEQGDSDEST